MPDDAVRSVARALQLMQALQRLQAASLAMLQAECALPKPTLLRLLRTLEAERVVWRAAGDGLWRPAFELRPTQILKPAHQRLIDAALPPLEALRRSVAPWVRSWWGSAAWPPAWPPPASRGCGGRSRGARTCWR